RPVLSRRCACPGPRIASEKLAILDEAGALRQLVVERSGGRIALVGEPIDAARTRAARALFHRRDQRTPESQMARVFGDEQVLQVAVVANRPARAVEEVVPDAAKAPAYIGAEHGHRFRRIVQARPGYRRGLVGDHDLVEGLVALPQRLPIRALIRADGPDHEIGCGHGRTPKGFRATEPPRQSATAPL